MKHLFLTLGTAVVVLGLALAGCRLSDKREVIVRAPGVKNEACAQRVVSALSVLDGVDIQSLRFDLASGAVVVTYESMKLGKKNIEHAFANAGFDANDIPAPASAKAALPEACR